MFLDPATGKNFFDRRDVLDLLKKRADGFRYGYRQNIAIVGAPYCGKTSVIYRFINDLPFSDVVAIYIEAKQQGFANFAAKFTAALSFQYLKAAQHKIEGEKELIPIMGEAMPRTAKAIKHIETLIKEGDISKAYAAVFELPALAYSETNLRPLIIIDEFHKIGDLGIEDAFSTLGKYIMLQKDTMYIVASSDISQAKKILSEKLSLLFGNFDVYELGMFDAATAINFMDFKLGPPPLPEDVKHFLAAFTGGHPFYLDCILLKLSEYGNSTPHCSAQDPITKAFEELLFDSKGILNQYFSNSALNLEKLNPLYVPLLSSISEGNKKIQPITELLHLKAGEARQLLNDIVSLGILSKHGIFYVFRDKVFEFWLRNVHQSKECRFDIDYASKASRFGAEVGSCVEKFLTASKQDYVQLLAELFCSFKGELVQLGKRRFVFPRFKKTCVQRAKAEGISYLIASNDKCAWAFLISQLSVTDDAIANFLGDLRRNKVIKRKVIISASDMSPNTRLLAKEAKIWIWAPKELNELLDIAGRQRRVFPEKAGEARLPEKEAEKIAEMKTA